MSEKDRCTPLKDGYAETLCDSLKKAAERSPSRKVKGVIVGQMEDFKNRVSLGKRITIRSGEYTSVMMLANFCPFCGGRLHDQFDTAESWPSE
jgi:hypothetical protein